MNLKRTLLLFACLLFSFQPAVAQIVPDRIGISVSVQGAEAKPLPEIESRISFPGKLTFLMNIPTSSWINVGSLEFDLFWPDAAPTNAQVMLYMKDWDYFWYQNLLAGYLVPGKENHFRVDLSPSAGGWEAAGHHSSWHLRALMEPKEFGIRVFCNSAYDGVCRLHNVFGVLKGDDKTAPFIRNVRANASRVPCFEKFELTLELPDRYPDPFDSNQVSVTADFEAPDGGTVRVDGFYGRSFYRKIDATGEDILPQGPPFWRVRFTPVKEGKYRYRLKVRDARGEAQWGPAAFEAVTPRLPGFVRVSKSDPRFFEFDNGSYFFPIGHNIRSPFDTRMDEQFAWIQRRPEGSSAYKRYFKAMREHGENLSEIWNAAWSLGLEWSPRRRGYHGIGQYNMIHAWEMDRVLEEAERNGIYLNFVVHNHGKFSTYADPEWDDNPFNVKNGGYLVKPEEYFTDERAQKSFRKLMRYIIARWGHSTRIFAWELWSELDLVGGEKNKWNFQKDARAVTWHKLMTRETKNMDPYGHMITSHVSGDYKKQNKDIALLPEMDFCAVDAYHGSTDPIQIVNVMRETAGHNNPFGKPVLITEFGGAWHAAGVKHLEDALHAGLWASTCIPLGGTPLFWWWQLVEEENFYPKFSALNRFMKGEDRRDPDMKMYTPELSAGKGKNKHLAVQCLKSRNRALGWIYRSKYFGKIDPMLGPMVSGLAVKIGDMNDGNYQAEFWDTIAGIPVTNIAATATSGALIISVPDFVRDIAFKVLSRP